jgi:adenosine kinase
MIEHARDFAAAGIPYIFDPGQGLPMFSGPELLELIAGRQASRSTTTRRASSSRRPEKRPEEIAKLVDCLAVTLGAEGSTLWIDGDRYPVPAVEAEGVVDPTGCGDAYRAGLLHGMARGWGWLKSARLASVMGALKISHRGGQNHRPSRDAIGERLRQDFGETL